MSRDADERWNSGNGAGLQGELEMSSFEHRPRVAGPGEIFTGSSQCL